MPENFSLPGMDTLIDIITIHVQTYTFFSGMPERCEGKVGRFS
jgi:hypothetical protein